MLSGLGTDYTYMGGQWNNSQTITYSVAPDGVSWDSGTNNVNATLNAEYGGSSWQGLIARALQTWASVTNLNFTQVADGPYAFNASGLSQGDTRFGDIRIGGYNFGTNSLIAQTYGPPPNGATGAGDVELNTGFNFAPGSHYDLETILIHELGHSLGLGESPQPGAAMYSNYAGARQSLSAYDIEGIQSLYGARVADAYQAEGIATSAASALDLTPVLSSAGEGHLVGLSLSTIGDVEYFSVVAPQRTGATLDVAAIAQGFSLLSPKISVIDPTTGATLAVNSNPNAYGNVALDSVANVQPGHRYLIAVTGATGDVFSVGSYGIQLGFYGGIQMASPLDPYAYNNTFATATNLGVNTQATINNLTLPTSSSYQMFTFQTTQPGPIFVGVLGADVAVGNSAGQMITGGTGLISFWGPRAGTYYLCLISGDNAPVNNYAFAVRTPVAVTTPSASSVTPPKPSSIAAPTAIISTTVEVETTTVTPSVSSSSMLSTATPTGLLRKPARPGQ